MTGLIEHLMRKHRLTHDAATRRAAWIVKQQAERTAVRKTKLARAQLTLGLDGPPCEEPADRFVETDPTVDF